jgi:hypothetical protein
MRQYEGLEKEINPFKKYIFKYWDKHGPENLTTIMNLFNIRPAAKLVLSHWLIEWYGGESKLLSYLKSLENKIMVGQSGSYDFKFFIKNSRIYSEKEDYPEIYFDAVADENGQVFITLDDGEIINNVYEASNNEEIGWEVDDEMRDIIRETISEFIGGLSYNISYNVDSIQFKRFST